MPWSIEKRGEKYCVIKDTDGSVHNCHATRAKATAQLRALYANEKSMAYPKIQGVGTKVLLVAETIRERAFGLSGMEQAELEEDGIDGMLFVHPTETFATFHMADMHFDLLIAFFDAAGGLVDQQHMSADRGGVHRPLKPFKYVIELVQTDPLPEDARLVLPIEYGREFPTEKRKKMASQGTAMPDGSFPIANVADLKNAIQAIGRAKNPAAAKAHIKRRAKALGATNLIPEDW